jgi:hypothetical protein
MGPITDSRITSIAHTFKTVVGDVAFGKDGECAKSRQLFTQFQNVAPKTLNNSARAVSK